MTIPVYRQNLSHDDWEVASVYDSDDSDSLGRSASYGSSHRSCSLDDAAFQSHDLTRPRFDYIATHPQSQQQHHNHAPVRSRWGTSHAPEKRGNFVPPPSPIIPPPGMIFPPKDWVLPPQDMYRPGTAGHMAPSSGMPVDIEPPASSLLLSPSSPPHAPSPLIRRPSPTKTIGHGQAPHARSVTASNAGTVLNVKSHASVIVPPPAHYHDPAHTVAPRLAEAGCQGQLSPLHDVLSPYGDEGSMLRRPEEITTERGGGGGGRGGYASYGAGSEPRPSKHEYGRMRTTRPLRRERRPSIWERFVRRFSPALGHT